MREIKFRAWDNLTKQMIEWFDIEYLDLRDGYISHRIYIGDGEATEDVVKGSIPGYELMQYTGLKDKNGKEIYEGDIILQKRVLNENSKNPKYENVALIVRWDDGLSHRGDKSLEINPHAKENSSWFNTTPKFVATPLKETKFTSYSWSPFHNCEVIGNIYENPELLEAAHETPTI